MKRLFAFALIPIFFICGLQAQNNLLKNAEKIIKTAFNEAKTETVTDSLTEAGRSERDSLKIAELMSQLEEMRISEALLRKELDQAGSRTGLTDSMMMLERRHIIDSLRALSSGVPVLVEGDTLFTIHAGAFGVSAYDRATRAGDMILKIGKERTLHRDTVRLTENEAGSTDIFYGDNFIVGITDQDALWGGVSRAEMSGKYSAIISAEINKIKDSRSIFEIAKRVVFFVLVVLFQYLLFRLTNYLFRKLRRRIVYFKQQKLKPVIVRDYELLDKNKLGKILIFFSNLLRYVVILIQLTFTVPILFAIFPQTEKLALKIFLYIIEPIKMVVRSIVDYIPNLFIILVIWFCIKYIIKGVQYIANEVENEKLKISGFYPDWAQPTFNIIRFLLYAFMIAMIYPYLPGSDSGVFQGISVFVGLIISLGSSTVIGNIIAGLVITYMRPFKLGDRIKLNDTTGNVIEKTPFVTRLRTPKNEVVTIPNSFIMSSHTVNYSESARQFGLIIHSTVTIGYDAPWRQVHQLLINAARMTPGVLEHPKPFVLETELSDYYPCYQINAYIKDADKLAIIMSDLHQNIQDTFNEAGVEIMSPHYFASRDGNTSTIPEEYRKD